MGKKVKNNLTDITEICVCPRQYLQQMVLVLKFCYKIHIELFLVVD